MEFRQLVPEPGLIDAQTLLHSVAVPAGATPERPYVVVNFIATVDGRSSFAGRSGGLGDDGDRALFHGLRERADGVLVGTRTLEAEGYGRMLGKEERRQRRLAAGRSAEPLACLVSHSGRIPAEIPLFAEPEARVVIFTATEVNLPKARAQVEVTRLDPGQLTLTTVLRRLRSQLGVELLLCEGGPMLFGSLLQEGLVDELFLTLSPRLSGGGSSATITSGAELAALRPLELDWILERGDFLSLRYRVA